jgi:hypothetical protein
VQRYTFSGITIRTQHTIFRSDDAIGTCCCHLIAPARPRGSLILAVQHVGSARLTHAHGPTFMSWRADV